MILFNSQTREHAWLSNFEPCYLPVTITGRIWNFTSVETAYQFAKTTDRSDEAISAWCRLHALEAKRRGKGLTRPGWETVKLDVMFTLVKRKFTANSRLRERLLLTFDEELIHCSPWDTFWGVDAKGAGRNELGKILMDIRDRRICFERDW